MYCKKKKKKERKKEKKGQNNVLCTSSHYSFLQFNEVKIILIFNAQMKKHSYSGGAVPRNDIWHKICTYHHSHPNGPSIHSDQHSPRAFTVKHWIGRALGHSGGWVLMLIWGPQVIASGTGRRIYKKNMSY